MGAMLPKPVESTVVERHGCTSFRVGVAEMNGFRSSMEDAHLIYTQSEWGFFGVFDGHGGDQCSAFVANRLRDELESQGCPKDDAAVKRLMLGVDQAFLDTEQASGSTGTMCIIRKPPASGGKFQLCVVNVGDSRVLLGRHDGSIVDGGGTEQGLTTDHKPNNPSERERIYRCGGTVEEATGGIARVNGELAVSRGFGDAAYKKTGGPAPEDRPVTANPEIGHFECSEADFVVLCCDGVCEADFENPQVTQLVAQQLAEKNNDPAAAAKAVCHKAIDTGSKDNITCMVVLLHASEKVGKDTEFIPGPLQALNNKPFMTAYEAMAKRAGWSLAQAAEVRYEHLLEELASPDTTLAATEALEQEKAKFGTPLGTKGSKERSEWFQNWLQRLPQEPGGPDSGPDTNMIMRMLLMQRPDGQELLNLMGGSGTPSSGATE